mmetsp:Transcript_66660/g.133840  ORF Transcript_66660/g.133840 Transcript_66660/m.133840 type:complete len:178 (+) Transcript_66660:21-554(+)
MRSREVRKRPSRQPAAAPPPAEGTNTGGRSPQVGGRAFVVAAAGASRAAARAWAATAAARRAGVEVRSIERSEWFVELAAYRFILSPIGSGIQRTANIEALLVLTVPILERCPYPVADDMVSMGFPVVVVGAWEEVTRERLKEWWSTFSPRLASFRAHCLTTQGYWHLLTGLVQRCT